MLNQFWAGEIPLFVVHRYKLLSDTRYYAAPAQTAAAAFLHRNGRRRWEIEVGKQEFFLVFGRLSYAPLPAKKLNMLIS